MFLLDPALGGEARPVPVPVDPAVWSSTLQHFVLSPDGKKVALVDGSRDAVAVLELATGTVAIVAPDRGRKSRTLPAWRSNDDLSFAGLPEEKSERPEVLLLKPGQPAKVLSSTWHADLLTTLRHPDPGGENEANSRASVKAVDPIWSRAECPDHRWRGHAARRHLQQGSSVFLAGQDV